eukprot:TRINITY_DN7383_c0_g1_i4.p1 TRINITY_DN7383_c0_g1~~TRINITY_DN7383_c0_g1_i4.p1  ORF type:complete len:1213 (+),score=339.00 TRINITY_DN7383_c0_g1_i4:57-3641(+)
MEYVTKLLSKIGGDSHNKKANKDKDKDKKKDKKREVISSLVEAELGYVASNYGCDYCFQRIALEEFRYHCLECFNYDYCHRCYELHGKEHGHYMSKEIGDPAKLARDIANGEFIWQVIKLACDGLPGRWLLGTIKENEEKKPYIEWITRGELMTMALDFGYGLRSLVPTGSFVGICSGNRYEWVVADWGCLFNNNIIVPIHNAYDDEMLATIVQDSTIVLAVVAQKNVPQFIKAVDQFGEDSCKLQIIVQIEPLEQEIIHPRLKFYSMSQVMKLGSSASDRSKEEYVLPKYDDISTIVYTSGSTGVPKGVIHTQHSWLNSVSRHFQNRFSEMVVDVSFSPLAHTTPRRSIHLDTLRGGCTVFCREDKNLIFDDFQLARPTIISSTPRLWNLLYSEYNKALAAAHINDPTTPKEEIEKQVLKLFETKLGNRIKYIITGGAPVNPTVLAWLSRCFKCWVDEGYGTSETGGIFHHTSIAEGVEIKLESVPDLGYFTTDKPNPRGEICVKSTSLAQGYWNKPDLTAEAFHDGWYHTGDIGEYDASTKQYKLIDRKKNFFKLAQGEFVAPERVEKVLSHCRLIRSIYVTGDRLRDYLVAVVVPNFQVLKTELNQSSDSVLKELILSDFYDIAEDKLQSFEIPRAIYIEKEDFTEENKLLTPTHKLNRPKLKQKYQAIIASLYEELEKENTKQRLKDILSHNLKMNQTDEQEEQQQGTNKPRSYVELGGDSLSAIKLAEEIRREFKTEVPLSLFFDKDESIEDALLRLIEEQNKNQDDEASSSSSSSRQPIDFVSESTISTDLRSMIESAVSKRVDQSELFSQDKILLTGCTGYIGIHLLAYLLESPMKPSSIHCLVRASSKQEGIERIKKKFKEFELPYHDEAYDSIIQIVNGDLAKPWLGLNEETFVELAKQTNYVYHVGAWVNGVFDYRTLKDANVEGTKWIIQLAVTERLKPIHYVSTISVLNDRVSGAEDHLSKKDKVAYMSGYAQSKWVAERLVHKANKLGLPAIITRPATIVANSQSGCANWEDFTHRIILSYLQTKSFPDLLVNPEYEKLGKQKLNWVPVDVCCKYILLLSRDFSVYNGAVVNLVNTRGYITWRFVIEATQQTKTGLQFNSVTMRAWKEANFSSSAISTALVPLRAFFTGSQFPAMGGVYRCDKLRELIRTQADAFAVQNDLITKEFILLFVDKKIRELSNN